MYPAHRRRFDRLGGFKAGSYQNFSNSSSGSRLAGESWPITFGVGAKKLEKSGKGRWCVRGSAA
jgi:hypothetical protein